MEKSENQIDCSERELTEEEIARFVEEIVHEVRRRKRQALQAQDKSNEFATADDIQREA